MKLYNIDNINSFMSCVRKCAGKVDYKDRSGHVSDLKTAAENGNGLFTVIRNGRIDEIEIHAALHGDTDRLFRYAMEACRS